MEGKKNNKRIAKLLKKAKGVTMLALVVTIIVLLILAAITLSLAVGENGIIKRAQLARDKAKNASIAEEEEINKVIEEINSSKNGSLVALSLTPFIAQVQKGDKIEMIATIGIAGTIKLMGRNKNTYLTVEKIY